MQSVQSQHTSAKGKSGQTKWFNSFIGLKPCCADLFLWCGHGVYIKDFKLGFEPGLINPILKPKLSKLQIEIFPSCSFFPSGLTKLLEFWSMSKFFWQRFVPILHL